MRRDVTSRLTSYGRTLGDRVQRLELKLLLALGTGAGCVWGFAAIADEVLEGEARQFDRALLLALRNPANPSDPLGPRWLEGLAQDITALGSTTVVVLIAVLSVGYLLIARKHRAALLVFVAVGGGMLLVKLMKIGFDRPRPELVPHAVEVQTASFPSAHSMLSAVTYLTLGALLARVHRQPSLKAYFLCVAVFITVAVGVTRVYTGVHWPTDVLAGWTAGAAWAIACWLVAIWLQRRGALRPDSREK